MSRHSLRLRLALAASALIALALALAGFGLVLIFDRVLDARTADELDRTAKQLAGQVALGEAGRPTLSAEPPDPRFATPYGGLYWQIGAAIGGEPLRSRSLWDARLDAASVAAAAPAPAAFDMPGPDGQKLIAVARRVAIERGGGEVPLTVVVAMDRSDLAQSRAGYLRLLVPSLVALGLVLACAMWIFVARALAPFRALREELRAVRDGRSSELPDRFPDEVRPLVEGLNRMISLQERALAKARTQAGDMAHGLKTPLAVLQSLARRIAETQPDLSRAIEEQGSAMGRQVERSLARARAAAARRLGRQSCLVAPVVERLVGALGRLPDAASLRWEVSVDPTLVYPGEEGDLTEMLGNLLDNARKWAHRRVLVTGLGGDDQATLSIEDDGPGMSQEAASRVARGRRWDESVPGTGFGLAIAADLAEETEATLALDRSPLGGLRARLTWADHDGLSEPREPPRPNGGVPS